MRVLAGDIGGTHARLALMELANGRVTTIHIRTVDSHAVNGLPMLVEQFRGEASLEGVGSACVAIAGAPVDGAWRAPNLPWTIPVALPATSVGLPRVTIINDFEAAGHAVPLLTDDDLVTLQSGTPSPGAPMALIGAGTGLGMAFLLWDGKRYQIHPSEGGHADFAPRAREECELMSFLRERHSRVSVERILSGRGLKALYDFYLARGHHPENARTRSAMEREDPAAVVTREGTGGGDPLCVQAVTLFTTIFGATAGNLALTALATGGVYLGGGIAPLILPALTSGPFLDAFRDKGRLAPLMAMTPIHVIRRTDVGLLGAASVAAAVVKTGQEVEV